VLCILLLGGLALYVSGVREWVREIVGRVRG
jgi:hypothetical protein